MDEKHESHTNPLGEEQFCYQAIVSVWLNKIQIEIFEEILEEKYPEGYTIERVIGDGIAGLATMWAMEMLDGHCKNKEDEQKKLT